MTPVPSPRTAIRHTLRLAAGSFLVLSLWTAWQPARADSPPACKPGAADQVRLEVSVSGMDSTKGNVTITIYPDDAKHFLDGRYKVARQRVPITLPDTHACFVLPAPGYYAVALMHDENNNGHFDTTLFGIPAEGYGFSRNPTLFLGPPDLSETRFPTHLGDNPIAIKMKYY